MSGSPSTGSGVGVGVGVGGGVGDGLGGGVGVAVAPPGTGVGVPPPAEVVGVVPSGVGVVPPGVGVGVALVTDSPSAPCAEETPSNATPTTANCRTTVTATRSASARRGGLRLTRAPDRVTVRRGARVSLAFGATRPRRAP